MVGAVIVALAVVAASDTLRSLSSCRPAEFSIFPTPVGDRLMLEPDTVARIEAVASRVGDGKVFIGTKRNNMSVMEEATLVAEVFAAAGVLRVDQIVGSSSREGDMSEPTYEGFVTVRCGA